MIMCTLTPDQIADEGAMVEAMYAAGMRGVRINTAHLNCVDQLDSLARSLKERFPELCILVDTKGPEVRTTSVAGEALTLVEGQRLYIEGDCRPTTDRVIRVNFPDINMYVAVGDIILIDDGTIALRVVANELLTMTAVVERGGVLGSKKGVAVAGVDLPLPAVSDRDREYISYAANAGCIDVIAHSFVRDASDVLAVKEVMGGSPKPVVAKIENRRGIDNVDGILAVADALLIARGDLTASIGKDAIPAAQAYLAEAAKKVGKPLYLATNILPSMLHGIRPSAADIEGIRLARQQGVDVMLLTNETAVGDNPVAVVEALARYY